MCVCSRIYKYIRAECAFVWMAIFHCGGGEKTILSVCVLRERARANERSRRHTELLLLPLSLNLISRPPKLAARDEKIIFSEQLNSVSIYTKPKCHGLRAARVLMAALHFYIYI